MSKRSKYVYNSINWKYSSKVQVPQNDTKVQYLSKCKLELEEWMSPDSVGDEVSI